MTDTSDPADEPNPAPKKKKGKSKKKVNKKKLDEFRDRFQKMDNSRKKHTAQAIARRRADVWEMMCQGVTKSEMANILGVHRETIALDVKYWKQKVGGGIERMKDDAHYAHLEIGLTMKKLDSVAEAAFMEYSVAKSGSEKDKFLNTAAKALSTKTRILQESGILPKAGVEIKAKIEHEVSFAQRFGPDSPLAELDDASSRHKVLDLAARLLKLAETPTVDADAIVKSLPDSGEPPADAGVAAVIPPTQDSGSGAATPPVDPAEHLLHDDPELMSPNGGLDGIVPPEE